jgi:hypothetical protein
MSFRLEYEVGEAGWATCRVAIGEKWVDMTASYLHDSLHQLCDVVASVAAGARMGTVIFMDEPGEHQMLLERVGNADVALRLVWHDDWASWGIGPRSDGQIVLQGTTTVAHLRGQTYAAARHILESLGAEEYRRRWIEHDFPNAAFTRLKEAGS